jgi:hypothetical protein
MTREKFRALLQEAMDIDGVDDSELDVGKGDEQ